MHNRSAIMITWRSTSKIPVCLFKSKDAVMTGRSYRAYGEDLPLQDSEYTDDTAFIFGSGTDAQTGIDQSMSHLLVSVWKCTRAHYNLERTRNLLSCFARNHQLCMRIQRHSTILTSLISSLVSVISLSLINLSILEV